MDAAALGNKVDVDDVDVFHADLRQQSADHGGPKRRDVVVGDVAGIVDLNLELTSSVTTDDDIAQGIIRVAENGGDDEGAEVFGGCDAIAMTTQGYSGPQPWVGSVAERVLETSRLPLLFVRPGV